MYRNLKMIRAALIDLSGTLHIENDPTTNAVGALLKLRNAGISVKFVTNTTKESSGTLLNRLTAIGFDLEKHEIHSSLSAAQEYVQQHELNPFYLLSEDARTEFPPTNSKAYDSVVVGLAPDKFNYTDLNHAFNILLAHKLEKRKLIAVHEGKYYKSSEGMALGPGCFVKGLEYATNTRAVVIGKPNPYFYHSALPADIPSAQCVMIGDDPLDDVAGAMKAGLQGILVKTGKYLPDIVVEPPPTAVVENFSAAVDLVLEINCAGS